MRIYSKENNGRGEMVQFKLISDYTPKGDQPEAIKQLVDGIQKGKRFQTLLGATGTGKTYTMANVISQLNIPTLVMAPTRWTVLMAT